MALTRVEAASWARSDSALWRRSLGVTYVLDQSEVVVLGGPAALVWELLAAPWTLPEMAGALAELHGVQPAEVKAEVDQVVQQLAAHGLVVTSRQDSAPLHLSEPDVPSHVRSVDALEPGAAIAGWGLAGCPLRLPEVEVAGWSGLFTTIRRERLTGLAVAAVLAGDLILSEADLEDLRDSHRDAMVMGLRNERLLLDTVALLERDGIEPLVIKGPSIAHLRYPDPSQRPFGDIDLLVSASQIDDTYEVLAAAGHHRRLPEPRPGFDQRFGKGATWITHDGLELDIHRTFAFGPFGMTVDIEDAFREPATFKLGGRTLRTLAGPSALVSVAMHAVLGTRDARLLNLRDVAQLLTQVDLEASVDLAHSWQVDAVVARAVRQTVARFELGDQAPLFEWAANHVAPAAQRRALRAYTSSNRSYARQAMAALPAIRGVRRRGSYMRAMLFPDRSYVRDRDGSQLSRWLRMARIITRRSG